MALAKRIVPQSLLGRSLLMILLPLLLLQAVTFQIFYGSHIEVVSRRLSSAIAGEVAFTVEAMGRFDDQADSSWLLDRARLRFGLEMSFEAGAHLGVWMRTWRRHSERLFALHSPWIGLQILGQFL